MTLVIATSKKAMLYEARKDYGSRFTFIFEVSRELVDGNVVFIDDMGEGTITRDGDVLRMTLRFKGDVGLYIIEPIYPTPAMIQKSPAG